MEVNLGFLDFDGLDDHQVNQIKDLLHPSNLSSKIEFPWTIYNGEEKITRTGNGLNVYAPVFDGYKSHISQTQKIEATYSCNGVMTQISDIYSGGDSKIKDESMVSTNGITCSTDSFQNECTIYSQVPEPVNGEIHNAQINSKFSNSKLNPTVNCFFPQNRQTYVQPNQDNGTVSYEPLSYSGSNVSNSQQNSANSQQLNTALQDNFIPSKPQNNEEALLQEPSDNLELLNSGSATDTTQNTDFVQTENSASIAPSLNSTVASKTDIVSSPAVDVTNNKPTRRSWAQIVSSGPSSTGKVPCANTSEENKTKVESKDEESLSLEEDKMALTLGNYFYEFAINLQSVNLQPRGLINRRNWCYINATLQALLGCSAFYTMIRELPLSHGIERGKSATPVIDSMAKVAYEFSQLEATQEELQVGQPFQPDFIYDMLRDLKSDCLKGQQEDAEEFLSFILNNMHEEMVKVLKNYKEKSGIDVNEDDIKENGDLSDGEEEWQVIGSKHKGMVTRKVVEHNSPISDLLGGQIKSFLTTSGTKTSASIQPFFTLQLDIQSENVNSVSEAIKEMTRKEPIQGYTCAKTKQEVEAFSHISIKKLPPVLILHLKRFVYNKNGGCKKVMKKTDYPLELELTKDLFSSDMNKRNSKRTYKLFAVMYHDGEEAVKGHYISDVYNHGYQTWIRCDDRQVTAVTETQVLSHTPPRVPYLLFYQECPL